MRHKQENDAAWCLENACGENLEWRDVLNWMGVDMTLHTPAIAIYHWIDFETAAKSVPTKMGIEADSFHLLEVIQVICFWGLWACRDALMLRSLARLIGGSEKGKPGASLTFWWISNCLVPFICLQQHQIEIPWDVEPPPLLSVKMSLKSDAKRLNDWGSHLGKDALLIACWALSASTSASDNIGG